MTVRPLGEPQKLGLQGLVWPEIVVLRGLVWFGVV
jgi:hypothetical protein